VALEAVRGSARFVGAAAEKFYAGGGHAFGDGEALFFGFDGARASDHGNVAAADQYIAQRRGDGYDGVFGLGIAADQLVGLANRDAFDDAGEGFEHA